MKRIIFSLLIVSLLAAGLVAQDIGGPDVQQMGILEAQQKLKEISVDKFEYEGYWKATMSSDEGYTTSRLFEGAPAAKEPIKEEEGLNIPDKYVLGVRVDFIRR
jgi:hypothetical protein